MTACQEVRRNPRLRGSLFPFLLSTGVCYETQHSTRFYFDRTDDRRGHHRHLGSGGFAAVPELHHQNANRRRSGRNFARENQHSNRSRYRGCVCYYRRRRAHTRRPYQPFIALQYNLSGNQSHRFWLYYLHDDRLNGCKRAKIAASPYCRFSDNLGYVVMCQRCCCRLRSANAYRLLNERRNIDRGPLIRARAQGIGFCRCALPTHKRHTQPSRNA